MGRDKYGTGQEEQLIFLSCWSEAYQIIYAQHWWWNVVFEIIVLSLSDNLNWLSVVQLEDLMSTRKTSQSASAHPDANVKFQVKSSKLWCILITKPFLKSWMLNLGFIKWQKKTQLLFTAQLSWSEIPGKPGPHVHSLIFFFLTNVY